MRRYRAQQRHEYAIPSSDRCKGQVTCWLAYALLSNRQGMIEGVSSSPTRRLLVGDCYSEQHELSAFLCHLRFSRGF